MACSSCGNSGCSGGCGEVNSPLNSNCQTCAPASCCGAPSQLIPCASVAPCCGGISSCPPASEQCHTSLCSGGDEGAALKVENSFNMPACGETAVLTVSGMDKAGVGSWIWNQNFGYLVVTQFDLQTHQLTVRNDCYPENSAPGTLVPSCSIFTNSAPDRATTGGGGGPTIFPYQVSDYVIPAVGDCVTTGKVQIQVTNTNGLAVGKNVQIAGNTYKLNAILSSTLIEVCNQGLGGTVGTTVFAEDGSGTLIHPIILVDTNPCTNITVLAGKLMVCNSGTQSPLAGTANGQIPVLDLASGNVTFQTIGIPTLDCTALTVCLTLDPTLPVTFEYLINVGDTSIFLVGELIQIGGALFTVASILNATQMRVVPVTPPGAILTYPPGTPVCDADCCDVLDAKIDCAPQVAHHYIGVIFFEIPYAFGNTIPADPRVFEANLGVFDTFVLPDDCENYAITAVVSAKAVSVHDSGVITNEVEIHFLTDVGSHQASKMVWTDYASDGWDIFGPPAPGVAPEATFQQVSATAPLFNTQYHQNDISTVIVQAAGTVVSLVAFVRTWFGDNNAPLIMTSLKLQLSGYIEIKRINTII